MTAHVLPDAAGKLIVEVVEAAVQGRMQSQSKQISLGMHGVQAGRWRETSCKQSFQASLWAGWTPPPRHAPSQCSSLPSQWHHAIAHIKELKNAASRASVTTCLGRQCKVPCQLLQHGFHIRSEYSSMQGAAGGASRGAAESGC